MLHASKGRRNKEKLQSSLTDIPPKSLLCWEYSFPRVQGRAGSPWQASLHSCMNKLPSSPGYILPKLLSLPCSAANHLFSQLLGNLWSSYCHAAHHGGSHCLTYATLDGVIFPCQTILCCPSKVCRIRGLTLYTTTFFRTGFTPPKYILRLLFHSSLPRPHHWVSFLCFWEKLFIHRNREVTC